MQVVKQVNMVAVVGVRVVCDLGHYLLRLVPQTSPLVVEAMLVPRIRLEQMEPTVLSTTQLSLQVAVAAEHTLQMQPALEVQVEVPAAQHR